jgi:hypothetical protein
VKLLVAICMALRDVLTELGKFVLAIVGMAYVVSLLLAPMTFGLLWAESGRLGPLWAILWASPVIAYAGCWFVERVNEYRREHS